MTPSLTNRSGSMREIVGQHAVESTYCKGGHNYADELKPHAIELGQHFTALSDSRPSDEPVRVHDMGYTYCGKKQQEADEQDKLPETVLVHTVLLSSSILAPIFSEPRALATGACRRDPTKQLLRQRVRTVGHAV